MKKTPFISLFQNTFLFLNKIVLFNSVVIYKKLYSFLKGEDVLFPLHCIDTIFMSTRWY